MGAVDDLREAVRATGIKQVVIAHDTGIPTPKISKILRGHQEPTVDEFIAIARAIGKDPALFVSDGDVVVSLQKLLDAQAAAATTRDLLASMTTGAASHPRIVPITKPAQRRDVRPIQAAANANVEFEGGVEEKRKRIPRRAWARKARRIVRAIGDSMEGPGGIANGELAYMKVTRNLKAAVGWIVVIRVNDALYLKTLEIIGRKLKLVSINEASHPPIEADERSDSIQLYGVIVDQESKP